MTSFDLSAPLLHDIRRRMQEESQVRIHRCLERLDEKQIWWRPNPLSNSVGNLVLHLAGNIRQWIVTGLGGAEDRRARQLEFDEQGPIPRDELLRRLDAAIADAVAVFERLTPADLAARYQVQGFDESGVAILVHVVEHLSYHTGQIAWVTKMLEQRDLGFYDDVDLDVTG